MRAGALVEAAACDCLERAKASRSVVACSPSAARDYAVRCRLEELEQQQRHAADAAGPAPPPLAACRAPSGGRASFSGSAASLGTADRSSGAAAAPPGSRPGSSSRPSSSSVSTVLSVQRVHVSGGSALAPILEGGGAQLPPSAFAGGANVAQGAAEAAALPRPSWPGGRVSASGGAGSAATRGWLAQGLINAVPSPHGAAHPGQPFALSLSAQSLLSPAGLPPRPPSSIGTPPPVLAAANGSNASAAATAATAAAIVAMAASGGLAGGSSASMASSPHAALRASGSLRLAADGRSSVGTAKAGAHGAPSSHPALLSRLSNTSLPGQEPHHHQDAVPLLLSPGDAAWRSPYHVPL